MLFGGAFILHTMPSLFAERIKLMLPIVKGSESYKRYTGASVPIHVKIYMFNVTNPEEAQMGAKPKLSQVGPFTLSETRRREVTKISPDNTTLDFKLYRSYFFNPNESVSLDSMITLPNAPAFTAFFTAEEKARDEESTAATALAGQYAGNESLYLTYSANEWLFKGIRMSFLDNLNADGVYSDQPHETTFGLYYKKNNTWDDKGDGIVTIATGADGDISRIGKVVAWNKKSSMSFWRGDPCNSLRGTEGQFFHPFVQKDERLEIFAPDLCRSLAIDFIKTTSLRTIELYRFGLSPSFFKPINQSENTKCFCVKGSHEAKQKFCGLGGVMDVSTCRKKPIVLSTPHFFNGDASLRQAVDGLSPSAANHDTFVDIEPITGLVLRVRRRLQINLEMISYDSFPKSHVLKDQRLIHPFIWLDQSIVAPDDAAQKLENKITKTIRMIKILCYAALITGPIILIATLIFICRDVKAEEKKIRGAKKKSTSSFQMNHSGDYQKVQVILKPMNNSSTAGASANSASNNKE